MPKSPEGYLISSVILNKDFKTAVAHGINAEMFRDFGDEWKWCEKYYHRNRKSPTSAAFKEKFPGFRLLKVDDTTHFVDRLKEHYAKVSLVESSIP